MTTFSASFYDGHAFRGHPPHAALVGLAAFSPRAPICRPQRHSTAQRNEVRTTAERAGPGLAKGFNKAVKGDGIGFKTTESKHLMRIPQRAEGQHIEIDGRHRRGQDPAHHAAPLADQRERVIRPSCTTLPASSCSGSTSQNRGDIILNPLDARCPYWGPSEELRRRAEAKAIAASLYQPTTDKKGEFFTETPQKIFAHLLTFGPTPQELVEWMANPDEIDRRVQNTEMAMMIAKGAQQQRNGVLASLGLIADSLRMLPRKEKSRASLDCNRMGGDTQRMDLPYVEAERARGAASAA